MKKAFQNSCAKGCLVYAVALVIILALSAAGLGGLSSRFGAGASGNRTSVESGAKSAAPAAGTTQDGAPDASQPEATQAAVQATVAPNAAQGSEQQPAPQQAQAQPTATPQPAITGSVPPPVSAPPSDAAQAPQPAQSAGISGEATAPFYIVQPGDTLWELAGRFNTTIDALKAANKLGDDFIKASQLLYLPNSSQPQSVPATAPQQSVPEQATQAPAPVAPSDGGTAPEGMPQMPNTGINTRP